jgi:hypothetical protein
MKSIIIVFNLKYIKKNVLFQSYPFQQWVELKENWFQVLLYLHTSAPLQVLLKIFCILMK